MGRDGVVVVVDVGGSSESVGSSVPSERAAAAEGDTPGAIPAM